MMSQPGETVSMYVAELRHIAEHCKFDNLESMLCDRLICGIQDPRIQRRLLAEAKLEFKQAFKLAQAMESANRNAKTLKKIRLLQYIQFWAKHRGNSSRPDVLLPKVIRLHVIGVKENTPPKAVVLRMLSAETVKKAISLVRA